MIKYLKPFLIMLILLMFLMFLGITSIGCNVTQVDPNRIDHLELGYVTEQGIYYEHYTSDKHYWWCDYNYIEIYSKDKCLDEKIVVIVGKQDTVIKRFYTTYVLDTTPEELP